MFFDIGGTVAVSYGTIAHWLISALALIAGVIAWVRVSGDAVRTNGVLRWILIIFWSWLGGLLVAIAMAGATWMLRVAREVYHPWYARPGRLLLLLFVTGVAVAWGMARLGRWLPARSHPARHPALTWSVALPIWIALAAISLWFAPAAAYLWIVPLFSAGVLLSITPPGNDPLVRVASIVVLCVSGTMWLREATELSRFIVAIMGRLPFVTPFFVYAAVLSAAGLMVAPPFIAVVATGRPLARPWAITAAILAGAGRHLWRRIRRPRLHARNSRFAGTCGRSRTETRPPRRGKSRRSSPASTSHRTRRANGPRPTAQRRRQAFPGAATASRSCSAPRDRLSGPPRPAIGSFEIKPLTDGSQLSISVIPREPGLLVTFVLPAGITPARSSLPGAVRLGRWTATYVAIPAEGIAWEASLRTPPSSLKDVSVAVTSSRFPGGTGWQSLPAWLPQDTAVWSSNATWVLPHGQWGAIAPVPPLR